MAETDADDEFAVAASIVINVNEIIYLRLTTKTGNEKINNKQ